MEPLSGDDLGSCSDAANEALNVNLKPHDLPIQASLCHRHSWAIMSDQMAAQTDQGITSRSF